MELYVERWEKSGMTVNPDTGRVLMYGGKVWGSCQKKYEVYKKRLSGKDEIYEAMLLIIKACYNEEIGMKILKDLEDLNFEYYFIKDHRQVHFLRKSKMREENWDHPSIWHCFSEKINMVSSAYKLDYFGRDMDRLVESYLNPQCLECHDKLLVCSKILLTQGIKVDEWKIFKHEKCLTFSDISSL